MEDFNKFEDVFAFNPDVAYKQQTVDDILRHRRTLENVLFIDRLLTTLSIEKSEKISTQEDRRPSLTAACSI